MIIPNINGKIKHAPNHQPDNQLSSWWFTFLFAWQFVDWWSFWSLQRREQDGETPRTSRTSYIIIFHLWVSAFSKNLDCATWHSWVWINKYFAEETRRKKTLIPSCCWKNKNTTIGYHWFIKLPDIQNTNKSWLVVWTPLKNISQLGWLATQYMGK